MIIQHKYNYTASHDQVGLLRGGERYRVSACIKGLDISIHRIMVNSYPVDRSFYYS